MRRTMTRNGIFVLILMLSVFPLKKNSYAEEGDGSGEVVSITAEEPTPTEGEGAVEEPTPTEEPAPTEEPTPSPTEEPTPTPTEASTPTPTEEPVPSPTEEPAPTPTEEPAPTEEAGTPSSEGVTPTPSGISKKDQLYMDFLLEKDKVEEETGTILGKIRAWLNVREEDLEKLPGWLRTGYSTMLVCGACLIPLSVAFGIILAKSHKENRKWVKRGYFGFGIVVPLFITAFLIGLPCLYVFFVNAF